MSEQPDESQAVSVHSSIENAAPIFATGVRVRVSNDHFLLEFLFTSAEPRVLLSRYALTPQHMKRLAKMLDRQVEQFESLYGEIAESAEPVPARRPRRRAKARSTKALKRE